MHHVRARKVAAAAQQRQQQAPQQPSGQQFRNYFTTLHVTEENAETNNDNTKTAAPVGPQLEAFYDRMRATDRSFYVINRSTQQPMLVTSDFYDDDEDAVERARREDVAAVSRGSFNADAVRAANRRARDLWYDLCRREYLKRQEQWRKQLPLFYSRLRILLAAALVFGVVLFYMWPVWHVLLDVKTDSYFATLEIPSSSSAAEIKKAYRTQTRLWHPDRRPDCGRVCRDRMMRIQEAYDNLIARGKDQDEAAQRRQNSYQEALLQLRHIIFFRAYNIAFHCAEYINLLVLSLVPAKWRTARKYTENIVRGIVIVMFVAMEIIMVTGFNPMVLLQVFYFVVNVFTSSAHKRAVERITKRSNFDYKKDFFVFLVPCALIHVAHFMLVEKYPQFGVFITQLLLGLAYVAAHLAAFSPNLFDNWSLHKCSVSLNYLQLVTEANGRMALPYSRWNFVTTEIGVILSDLFAFTTNVPAVFRVVVLLIHVIYLAQLALLPWDAPVTGRVQRKYEARYGASGGIARSVDDEEEGTRTAISTDSGNITNWRDVKGNSLPKKPLTSTERAWFSDLDRETAIYADIAYLRYRSNIAKHFRPGGCGTAPTTVVLGVTSDLQEVCVVTHIPQKVPVSIKDPELREVAESQARSQGTVARVVERHKDSVCAALLYRDFGANCVLPPQVLAGHGSAPVKGVDPILIFRRLGGALQLASMTNSEVRGVSLLRGFAGHPVQSVVEPLEGLRPHAVTQEHHITAAPGTEAEAEERALLLSQVASIAATLSPFRMLLRATIILLVVTILSLSGVLALYQLPSHISLLRGANNRQAKGIAATAFEPFLTPVAANKYHGLLPPDHALNRLAAGGIVIPPLPAYDVKLPVPVFLPDLWECLRQLTLFTSTKE